MEILMRLVIGLLSLALCIYAVSEIIQVESPFVWIPAGMLFCFGLCGIVESLKKHQR